MYSEKIVAATIISKNYLSFARTFTDSFLKNNPNGEVFVLLVDDINNHFDPKNEKFNLINIKDIGIKNLESFCFKYTTLEQNTGTKAHFLKFLFEKYKLNKLAYFDPDILITNSLENLWKLLDKKSIVLTPHITESINDDKRPSDDDIKKAGKFNLGFIALANNKITHDFLNWWFPLLMEHGYSDVSKGMFTDQKWIDNVPSKFENVYVITHPGYNVAYWNLMHRKVKISNNKINVNGKPMYFFHFSGFSPEDIEQVSRHQNRFTLSKIKSLRPLFELYRDLLVENGYLDSKNWKCKFEYFENGLHIPDSARKIYAHSLKEGLDFGNPFITYHSDSFINYLNENVDNKLPKVTRLWYQIYQERKDLHSLWSDPLEKDRLSFVKWIENSVIGKSDCNISLHMNEKAGINMAGYFKGEFGIAEAARNYAKAMKIVGIPHVLNKITSSVHRNEDQTFDNFSKKNPYTINLIAVNADQSEIFFKEIGENYFKNRYNIGIWFWELTNFPNEWLSSLKFYDEIWVSTNFMAESMSKSFTIPVTKIGCPVEIDEKKLIRNRSKFNLKEDEYVFLFIFDFLSIFERKNPLGVIEAFKKIFKETENISLIIKCTNGARFPTQYKKLSNECNQKNIHLLGEHMTKDDLYSLIETSDCYVSLHRSEGFALTIAEAMYAGKPVIATEYGGNSDFMNTKNSFPVKYKITKIDDDYGPYKKGNEWAEPDIEHASTMMRYVFEHKEESKKIGFKAKDDLKQNFSLNKIGIEISKRIQNINKKIISVPTSP